MTQNTWKNHSFYVIRFFVHFSTNKSWSWPWRSRACISVNGLLTVDTPTGSHQSSFKAFPWWRQPQLAACPVAGSLQMSSFPSRSLFTGGVAARRLVADSQRDPSVRNIDLVTLSCLFEQLCEKKPQHQSEQNQTDHTGQSQLTVYKITAGRRSKLPAGNF